jgi:hypothetical protein
MTIVPQNQRYEPLLCSTIRSALVWPIALAAFVFATASSAEDMRKGAIPDKEVQAKLQYCKVLPWCFGAGFPWFLPDTAPRRTATHISGKSAASFH